MSDVVCFFPQSTLARFRPLQKEPGNIIGKSNDRKGSIEYTSKQNMMANTTDQWQTWQSPVSQSPENSSTLDIDEAIPQADWQGLVKCPP